VLTHAQDVVIADFCYNYLTFSPTGVHLKIPGGFSLDMMKLWDGRPVHFVCCARSSGEGPPVGEVFFVIAIEVLQEGEEEEEEEEAGGKAGGTEPSSDDVD
jgi:hypothetical protein